MSNIIIRYKFSIKRKTFENILRRDKEIVCEKSLYNNLFKRRRVLRDQIMLFDVYLNVLSTLLISNLIYSIRSFLNNDCRISRLNFCEFFLFTLSRN